MMGITEQDLRQALDLGNLCRKLLGTAARSFLDAGEMTQAPDKMIRTVLAAESLCLAAFMIARRGQPARFMQHARRAFYYALSVRKVKPMAEDGNGNDTTPQPYDVAVKDICNLIDGTLAHMPRLMALDFLEELGLEIDSRIDARSEIDA